jgi:hypothetical protein
MIETIISGILLASISGVTFLAYKHPKGYFRLYWFLMPATAIAFAWVISNDRGLFDAKEVLVQFIPQPIDWQRVNDALDKKMLAGSWTMPAQIAIWVYLTLLLFLHRIISDKARRSAARASTPQTK